MGFRRPQLDRLRSALDMSEPLGGRPPLFRTPAPARLDAGVPEITEGFAG